MKPKEVAPLFKEAVNVFNIHLPSCLGAVSGSRIRPNCGKEHDSDAWNGHCSKICWWGFPVDYH